jgi:hypothetical protein
MDHIYLTLRMQRWHGRIASSTARVWPCVSPFLFRQPMEIALSAPPALRVRNRLVRRLMEHLNPRLAALPLAEGYPALPLRLTTAHRFWPALRHHIGKRILPARHSATNPSSDLKQLWEHEEIRDHLTPGSMSSASLYRPEALRALLDRSESGQDRATITLRRIITLEALSRKISSEHSHSRTNAGRLQNSLGSRI